MAISKALAEPIRCDILRMLQTAGELCCQEIWQDLPVTQATVSHHLKLLGAAGLVRCRRDGQFAIYTVDGELIELYLRELRRRLKPVSPGRPRVRRHS